MKTKEIINLVFILFMLVSSINAQKLSKSNDYNFKKSLDLNKTQESLQFMNSTVIKIPVGEGKYLEDIKSFDINSDGTDELIILSNYSGATQIGQLLIYKWVDNQFELLWESIEFNGYPYGMQISDIDNDGKKDILLSLSGLKFFKNADSIFIYKGNLTSHTPDEIFLADNLDNDNYKDLALGSPDSNGGLVKLYKQNPTNTTFSYVDTLTGTPGSNMVKGININSDSSLDIVKAELYSGDIHIYKNNGNFNFENIYDTTLNTRIFCIESKDFDNDSFEDFIVAEAWANVHFFKNTGADSYEVQFSGSDIGSAFNSQAYDIDYDGFCDLVVGAFDGNVYLYHNLGGFNFNEIQCPISASSNYGLTVGDFNNDGKSDVAFGEDTVLVLLNLPSIFGLTSIKDNSIVEIPNQLELYQNFPNPFNPTTSINFRLLRNENVELCIYNSNGQIIRKLYSGSLNIGIHSFSWDGKNDNYQSVSSGIYFYSLKTLSYSKTKKMLLLR